MAVKKIPTCGDCIHADVCEHNPNIPLFNRANSAYCVSFKDRTKYDEVVRCKDCIHWYDKEETCLKIYSDGDVSQYAWQVRAPNDFCSYGESRET